MMIEIKKNGLLKYKDFSCRCSVGKSGIKSKKIEGDNATPKGIFSLGKIYYRKDRIKNIQSKLSKKKITKGMGWCHNINSKKYNKESKFLNYFETENLFRKDFKYDFVIPINYNTKNTKLRKGSAIFIHLTKSYKPTTGCIALSKKDLIILLKLINRSTKIKIL